MTDAATALFRSLNSPLIVATTASNGQTAGCVAGFHTQCSIDPVRYAVWLSKANHTYRVALFATHLAVHFLDVADHELAARFGGLSGDDVDKFAGIDWTPGPGGVPLIDGCPNRLVLQRATLWDDGSDHLCIVGEPIDASVGSHELDPMRI
ncbi:MAG: flavin reductase, partial [Ilumatobacteraceae bacterium]|nr:flavin reductase [Ilumatobacteraceae bacterium]